LRRLFRNVPAAEVLGKEIDAPTAIHRRVEITVERQTISVLQPAGVVQTNGETRCRCCGQVIAPPLSVCCAHEAEALPGETSGPPNSEMQEDK
jgi:hypothetical protein